MADGSISEDDLLSALGISTGKGASSRSVGDVVDGSNGKGIKIDEKAVFAEAGSTARSTVQNDAVIKSVPAAQTRSSRKATSNPKIRLADGIALPESDALRLSPDAHSQSPKTSSAQNLNTQNPSSRSASLGVRYSEEREAQLREKSIRSRQWREELERKQRKTDSLYTATNAASANPGVAVSNSTDSGSAGSNAVNSNAGNSADNGTIQTPLTSNAVLNAKDASNANDASKTMPKGASRGVSASNQGVRSQDVGNSVDGLTANNSKNNPSQQARKPFNNPWLSNQQASQIQYPSNASSLAQAKNTLSAQNDAAHEDQAGLHSAYQDGQPHNSAPERLTWDEAMAHSQLKGQTRQPVRQGASSEDSKGLNAEKQTETANEAKPSKSSNKPAKDPSKKESPLGVVLIVLAVLCVLIAVSLLTGLWDISNLS